jgi:L-threonylcarbamoyladenylate synthase
MPKIILYPTDTVYGLGVDATDADAVRALKALKSRSDGQPISIIVADIAMAERYAEVTPLARKLADKFLPGKLTIVLMAKNLPDEITAGTGTVGVRIPAHPAPLALVRELGKPITATSANVSGMTTMNTPTEILKQFGEKAAAITRVIDGGALPESLPSTVVDARGEAVAILREGAIAGLAIEESMR